MTNLHTSNYVNTKQQHLCLDTDYDRMQNVNQALGWNTY
jgi:hypothetical protein